MSDFMFMISNRGKIMRKQHIILFFVAFGIFYLRAPLALASSVVVVDFDQVVVGSEFIFEGNVVSKEIRPSPISGKPFTYYSFEIIEVIKGNYSNPTIEIGFMGGTLEGRTLTVSDMVKPEVGEQGIYFVESLGRQQVHPFYGWHQGHYLVIPHQKSGVKSVVPVLQKQSASRVSRSANQLTLEAFKQTIRDAMGMK